MNRYLIVLCCVIATGCHRDEMEPNTLPDAGGESGTIVWKFTADPQPGIERASVFHMGKRFVLWSDLSRGGGGGTTTNVHGLSCNGRLRGDEGVSVPFECKSPDGKTGTAVIDGRTFDLADGGLFLVAAEDGTPRIKQLKRDLESVPFSINGLQKFAREDKEIAGFFAEAEVPSDDI